MVDIVEWLVSVLAVQVIVSSALTICFGFASRDGTFHGSTFYVLFKKEVSSYLVTATQGRMSSQHHCDSVYGCTWLGLYFLYIILGLTYIGRVVAVTVMFALMLRFLI